MDIMNWKLISLGAAGLFTIIWFLIGKYLFKKRKTYYTTGVDVKICFDPEDKSSVLSIWFEYQNKFGKTSSTPAVKMSREMVRDIVKQLYSWNLFTMEDLKNV